MRFISLYTGITNSLGVVSCELNLTQTTTIYCSFTGTSDYNSCVSNSVTIEVYLYAPLFDGSEPIHNITEDRPLVCSNGVCGGYNQVGYLSDGWDNTVDWELTATIRTSTWDGGISLFSHPFIKEIDYPNCTESGPWDCIFKYPKTDGKGIIQWVDGYLKYNDSSLKSTPIGYTKNTTMNIKITKIGNVITYYENEALKGSWTWNDLNKRPKMYLGVCTWGNSGSVNTWSNVKVERIE